MDPPAALQITSFQEPSSPCNDELIRRIRKGSQNQLATVSKPDGSRTSTTDEDLASTDDPSTESEGYNLRLSDSSAILVTTHESSSASSTPYDVPILPHRTQSCLSSPSPELIGLVRAQTAPSATKNGAVLPIFKDQVLGESMAREQQQRERQRVSSDSITTQPNIFAYAEPMSAEFDFAESAANELHKRRRVFCLYTAIIVSLLAMLFCGLAVGLIANHCGRGGCIGASTADQATSSEVETNSPTSAPSENKGTAVPTMIHFDEHSGSITDEQAFVVEYINEINLSEVELRYPAPANPLPEELSLEWLVKIAYTTAFTPMELRQAFALASFWFQSVVKPIGLEWLTDSTDIEELCTWNRVECDRNGEIVSLDLSETQAHGTIPNNFGLLTALTNLDVSSNALSGPIPYSLGMLSTLQTLIASSNKLSGAAIPTSMLSMTSLKTLVLDENPLGGTIPKSIDRLVNLEALTMRQTSVMGELPASISNLDSLQVLGIYESELSGTIPESLTTMTQLTALWLRDNQLSGELLPNITSLTNLLGLSLGGNKLTGTIPTDIGVLTKLTLLSVEKNSLMGTIPSSVGKLTLLTLLKFEGASLSGPIPNELGDLSALTQLDFMGNKLTGTIPQSLGQLTRLKVLEFSDNRFEGQVPTTMDRLTNLNLLSYRGNQLNGTIATSIGRLLKLEALSFAENEFTGSLPSQLGLLTSLEWLSVRANKLTGTIPSELASLGLLSVAQFYNNDFNGTVALCENPNKITALYADCNEVSCPCCTACCPAGGWNDIQGLEKTSVTTPCDS